MEMQLSGVEGMHRVKGHASVCRTASGRDGVVTLDVTYWRSRMISPGTQHHRVRHWQETLLTPDRQPDAEEVANYVWLP